MIFRCLYKDIKIVVIRYLNNCFIFKCIKNSLVSFMIILNHPYRCFTGVKACTDVVRIAVNREVSVLDWSRCKSAERGGHYT